MEFLFKQWGEWAPPGQVTEDERTMYLRHNRGWNTLVGESYVEHYGKKAAGRLLDGVEHNGVPT